jgi:ribosome-associated translation inhibitor RaiA
MQFQVETDNHIQGQDRLSAYVESVVTDAVDAYAERLTHIEAHLGDVNAGKAGAQDKRCMLEARVSGVKNVVVTHHAENLELAIEGAAAKLRHALDSAIGKMQDKVLRAEGTGRLGADLLDPGAAA